jgi:hypothetical protein
LWQRDNKRFLFACKAARVYALLAAEMAKWYENQRESVNFYAPQGKLPIGIWL